MEADELEARYEAETPRKGRPALSDLADETGRRTGVRLDANDWLGFYFALPDAGPPAIDPWSAWLWNVLAAADGGVYAGELEKRYVDETPAEGRPGLLDLVDPTDNGRAKILRDFDAGAEEWIYYLPDADARAGSGPSGDSGVPPTGGPSAVTTLTQAGPESPGTLEVTGTTPPPDVGHKYSAAGVPTGHDRTPNKGEAGCRPDQPDFAPGLQVEHSEYGVGEVTGVSGAGSDRRVTIRFAGYGEKRFVADKVVVRLAGGGVPRGRATLAQAVFDVLAGAPGRRRAVKAVVNQVRKLGYPEADEGAIYQCLDDVEVEQIESEGGNFISDVFVLARSAKRPAG
jgi:hypothetical protein